MTNMKNVRLRWKMDAKETGLRRIAAGPRGSSLIDGELRYATVSALGRSREQWYWVAGWDSGLPYKNTCQEPPLSLEDAKAAALAYVKEHMKAKP